MTIQTRFRPELVHPSAYVAPNATLIGDVTLGEKSSVWFGAVIRGDTEKIVIGRGSNVQDLCLLHADAGLPCSLGEHVTLGHAAIVHGATIEDTVLIGMRAVILNGARVGAGSLIAAGSVVPEGRQIPPGSVAMGTPARVIRPTTEEDRARIRHAADHYIETARAYAE